ncbi:hypothetical protein CAEBREN_07418 [Caenorhabditis brenneri]|uniref:Tyrosine-protein phosphatase domain-containing protein n=1 Tax=Caenorhabditis brenneri TaxID=135651 RepID=G0MZT5_CAEBE|nr:hypothetical protein CAEBREN_07418 [Caenorhabditis brenneri]
MSYRKEKRKLLIFNIHFWMMLSITFDTGFCATRTNKKPISYVYGEKTKNFDTSFVLRNPPVYENWTKDFEFQEYCENNTNAFSDGMISVFANKGHPFPVNEHKESDDLFSSFGKMWEEKSFIQKPGFVIPNFCEDMMHIFSGKQDYVTEKYRLARNSPANTNPTPANDESPFLKHTTIISHVVNGIFLQTGLMNGKIPVDELAGEILNFGSVRVSDIVNFQPNKITDLTGRLKEASKTLNGNSNPEVQKLEEKAIKWNQLRLDYESAGDNFNADNGGSYLKDIATLKGMLADLTGIDAELKRCIGQINAMKDNSASLNEDLLRTALNYLSKFDEHLKNKNEKFKTAVQKLGELNSLKEGLTIFKPLATMVHIMSNREEKFDTSPDNVESIKKNIEHVAQSVESFKSSSREIKNINELVRRKSNPQARSGKYTHGFTNGISDLEQLGKDSRDPWIAKITHFDVSKLNGLSDGLMPLMKFIDPLSKADNNLDPILSDTIPQSFMELDKVQETVTMMPTDSISSVTVLNDFSKCQRFRPPPANLQTSTNFIENVKVLSQLSTTFSNAVGKLNEAELAKPITDFIKSIGFSMNMKDLKPVAQKLKTSTEFEKLKAPILEAQKSLGDLGEDKLENDVIRAIETGDGTKETEFTAALKVEKEHAKCLQGLSEKSEKFAKAVQVVRTLRGFDVKKYENVELASSSIAKASKDLAPLKSIKETMKKIATERANLLNKLKDSDKKSQSIGQSVSSLLYAYGLKGLESSIAQLKSVGPMVETEINKIQSPIERKTVEDQWGNHQTHISDLEASLAKIKAFEATVDISKASTIAHYGAPLKNLETISDAKINAQDKLKAVDALSEHVDPANKGALEDAKKTLRTISTLNLDFSSHNSQFQSAPAAFKAFNDFLLDFLAVDTSQETTTGISLGLMIGIIVGIVFLLSAAALAAYLLYLRKKKKDILAWIEKQKFDDPKHAAEIISNHMRHAFLTAKVDYAKSIEELGTDRHRYPNAVPCQMEKMVKFTVKNEKTIIKVHGNYVAGRKKPKKYIATQGPTKHTFEDFWLMAMHEGVEFIVMLCRFIEGEGDQEKEKCGEYFHSKVGESLKFGSIKVKTISSSFIFGEDVKKIVLEVVDEKKRYGKLTITLYHHVNWPDASVPKGHATVYDLMQLVNKSKAPVIVHCSAGIGRTVSFIGLDIITEAIEHNPHMHPNEVVLLLRSFRALGIQKSIQLYWLLLGVVYTLTKKYKFDEKHYKEQYEVFEKAGAALGRCEQELQLKNKRDMLAERTAARAGAADVQNNDAVDQENRADGGVDQNAGPEVADDRMADENNQDGNLENEAVVAEDQDADLEIAEDHALNAYPCYFLSVDPLADYNKWLEVRNRLNAPEDDLGRGRDVALIIDVERE